MHINDNCGARRLFSPSNRNAAILSEDYDSDEYNKNQSTFVNNRSTGLSFSPTLNLPNSVEDGTGPHLLQISPRKHKENVNWLTQMKEKYEQRIDKTTMERPYSPKDQTTPPARKSNGLRSHKPRKVAKSKTKLYSLDIFKAIKSCENNPTEDSSIVPSTSTCKRKKSKQLNDNTDM